MTFKVGDRVRTVTMHDSYDNWAGVIESTDDNAYKVRFYTARETYSAQTPIQDLTIAQGNMSGWFELDTEAIFSEEAAAHQAQGGE